MGREFEPAIIVIECDLCGCLIYRGISEIRKEPKYGSVIFVTHLDGDTEHDHEEDYLCDSCFQRAHQGFHDLKAEIISEIVPTPGKEEKC